MVRDDEGSIDSDKKQLYATKYDKKSDNNNQRLCIEN